AVEDVVRPGRWDSLQRQPGPLGELLGDQLFDEAVVQPALVAVHRSRRHARRSYERCSRTRSPTADIWISAPVTSFSSSSAVGFWPMLQSSRSREPRSRWADQTV